MFDLYEVNEETLAILYEDENKTRIISDTTSILTNLNPKDIIKNSCLYYGSSLQGRLCSSKIIINSNIKLPIVIDDIHQLIFFPTKSVRMDDCSWISFNNIEKYMRNGDKTTIVFTCGKIINLDVSFNVIDNQVTRCIKLEREIQKRREKE